MIYLNFKTKFNRNKLACFDFDYTLIKTKSGKKFPIDKNDWVWLYDNIPNKIKELYNDNYNIIIFSNQLGISKKLTNKDDIIYKIKNIYESLNIPIVSIIADENDKYRKPRIGSWKYIKKLNEVKISKKNSFYIGDMAGRLKYKNRKKDRSDSDRKFALNCKIKFYTPEEFFLNEEEIPWKLNGYQLNYSNNIKNEIKFSNNKKNIILIIGYPGSGKTTLANKFKNYILLSKDLYGKKFNKILKDNINNGNNIIIEGLLYNFDKRKIYINLAKKHNYEINIINIKTSYELSNHLNIYRSLKNKNKIVPLIVYNTYRKYYTEPDKNNFNKIINYNPILNKKINKYYLY